MICIFKGAPQIDGVNLSAGDVQMAIENQIGPCEHDGSIQQTGVGCFRLTKVSEQEVTRSPIDQDAVFSPSLDGLTLDNFPDGFSFGNGVGCNALVPMKDGTLHVLSWVVFPPSQAVAVRARYASLLSLMEP